MRTNSCRNRLVSVHLTLFVFQQFIIDEDTPEEIAIKMNQANYLKEQHMTLFKEEVQSVCLKARTELDGFEIDKQKQEKLNEPVVADAPSNPAQSSSHQQTNSVPVSTLVDISADDTNQTQPQSVTVQRSDEISDNEGSRVPSRAELQSNATATQTEPIVESHTDVIQNPSFDETLKAETPQPVTADDNSSLPSTNNQLSGNNNFPAPIQVKNNIPRYVLERSPSGSSIASNHSTNSIPANISLPQQAQMKPTISSPSATSSALPTAVFSTPLLSHTQTSETVALHPNSNTTKIVMTSTADTISHTTLPRSGIMTSQMSVGNATFMDGTSIISETGVFGNPNESERQPSEASFSGSSFSAVPGHPVPSEPVTHVRSESLSSQPGTTGLQPVATSVPSHPTTNKVKKASTVVELDKELSAILSHVPRSDIPPMVGGYPVVIPVAIPVNPSSIPNMAHGIPPKYSDEVLIESIPTNQDDAKIIEAPLSASISENKFSQDGDRDSVAGFVGSQDSHAGSHVSLPPVLIPVVDPAFSSVLLGVSHANISSEVYPPAYSMPDEKLPPQESLKSYDPVRMSDTESLAESVTSAFDLKARMAEQFPPDDGLSSITNNTNQIGTASSVDTGSVSATSSRFLVTKVPEDTVTDIEKLSNRSIAGSNITDNDFTGTESKPQDMDAKESTQIGRFQIIPSFPVEDDESLIKEAPSHTGPRRISFESDQHSTPAKHPRPSVEDQPQEVTAFDTDQSSYASTTNSAKQEYNPNIYMTTQSLPDPYNQRSGTSTSSVPQFAQVYQGMYHGGEKRNEYGVDINRLPYGQSLPAIPGANSPAHPAVRHAQRRRKHLNSPTQSQFGELSDEDSDEDGFEEDDIDFKDLMKR